MDTETMPTDNPNATAVPPDSIPAASAETLLNRVHAKLSSVESSVVAIADRVESWGAKLLAEVRAELAKAGPVVGAVVDAVASGAGVPIRVVANAIEALLCPDCGHDALHTAGGCTAAGCTCKTPPARRR